MIRMTSNRTTEPGRLLLRVKTGVVVHMHSPEDVPHLPKDGKREVEVAVKKRLTWLFSVREVINGLNVRDVEPERRRCRFPDENYLGIYREYSYSACVVHCRKEMFIQMCNCTTHFTPRVELDDVCGVDGLLCISNHWVNLVVLRDEWAIMGIHCPCMQSCTELDIKTILRQEDVLDDDTAILDLQLAFLPSERFARNLVKNKLDMIVSTGGTVGLFMGASVLSLIELFHYFVLQFFGHKTLAPPPSATDGITHRRFRGLARLNAQRSQSVKRPNVPQFYSMQTFLN